jgi:hypothetical protein
LMLPNLHLCAGEHEYASTDAQHIDQLADRLGVARQQQSVIVRFR